MIAARRRIALLHLGRIHDETPTLRALLAQRGIATELVPLAAAEAVDWGRFDRVSVRDCRDSHRHDDFLRRITTLARRLEALGVPLVNPLAVVLAGHAKSGYLPGLEREGIRMIPSRWLPRGWRGSPAELLEECGWREAVLKPAIGSRSWLLYRLRRRGHGVEILAADGARTIDTAIAADADGWLAGLCREGDWCLQRFLPSIHGRGEVSAVFLAGRFSHAVAKSVAGGGWIAHESFGGHNRLHPASAEERRWSEAVEERLRRRFGVLPYARIDGIHDEQGDLLLLECELVIPRLFLGVGNAFGRYADVLTAPPEGG